MSGKMGKSSVVKWQRLCEEHRRRGISRNKMRNKEEMSLEKEEMARPWEGLECHAGSLANTGNS